MFIAVDGIADHHHEEYEQPHEANNDFGHEKGADTFSPPYHYEGV